MTDVVTNPRTGRRLVVQECRSCHAAIYWDINQNKRYTPYDVTTEGEASEVTHFATCPDAKDWRRG